ncbi:hypothetical protein MMPV_007048 [Pyropia vietnamensis]
MAYRRAPCGTRGLAAIATTATAATAAAAAAITALVAPSVVAAIPAVLVSPSFPAGAPPGVSVFFHPILGGPPRPAPAAPRAAPDPGDTEATTAAAAAAAAAAVRIPSTLRRFVPSDLAATFSVVNRPMGAFSRSACPATTIRHEHLFRRGANPNVYDVPHAYIFMDGTSCGRATDVARGRNMTLVAASVLASASSAAAARVTDVWEAVQGRPSMAQMLRYTGDARDVYVGWERHNRKCGRSHTYRKGTLFFFIASDTRQLSEVGVQFDHAQPFVVSFNPAVCVMAAPVRAAASRLPQTGGIGGATQSAALAATSPAGAPATASATPVATGTTSPTATAPSVDGPAPEEGNPTAETPEVQILAPGTPAAGSPAAGAPTAGRPTASPPPGPRPETDAEEAALPAIDGAVVATPTSTPTPLPATTQGDARAGDDGGAACFPATARVTLADGRVVPIAALRLGDEVMSRPGGEASAVYLFTHRQPGGFHDFLRIVAAPVAGNDGAVPDAAALARNRTLTLSASHYVYVSAATVGSDGGQGPARLVTAHAVRAGDRLRDASGADLAVVSVSPVSAAGLYNPHTLLGELVVDGVHVSCLTAAVPPRLATVLLEPLRWAWCTGVGRGGLWGALHQTLPRQVLAFLPRGRSAIEL